MGLSSHFISKAEVLHVADQPEFAGRPTVMIESGVFEDVFGPISGRHKKGLTLDYADHAIR